MKASCILLYHKDTRCNYLMVCVHITSFLLSRNLEKAFPRLPAWSNEKKREHIKIRSQDIIGQSCSKLDNWRSILGQNSYLRPYLVNNCSYDLKTLRNYVTSLWRHQWSGRSKCWLSANVLPLAPSKCIFSKRASQNIKNQSFSGGILPNRGTQTSRTTIRKLCTQTIKWFYCCRILEIPSRYFYFY